MQKSYQCDQHNEIIKMNYWVNIVSVPNTNFSYYELF